MGLFSGLSKASATEGRHPFISKTGVTVVEVLRHRAGQNREKVPFFSADLEIVEVVAETPLPASVIAYNEKAVQNPVPEGAHQVGEKVTFYIKVASPQIDSKLGNIKNHAEAVFDSLNADLDSPKAEGWIAYDEYDDDDWEKAIMDPDEGLASGEGDLCEGMKLVMSVEARIGVKSGNPYTVATFSPYTPATPAA